MPASLRHRTMTEKILNIYTDGGSRGNPGPAAAGVVIKDKNNRIIHQFGLFIGTTTNNQAEYAGVVLALEYLKDKNAKPQSINFFLDSSLVVNQLNGLWKVKDSDIRQKIIFIRQLEANLKCSIFYTHIPRSQNQLADTQVNLALDNL